MREADLERHLANPTDKDEEPSKPVITPPKEGEGDAKKPTGPVELGSKGDYQLNQALNLLKGLQIISRK
jgi:carboxyl-terminal processing protease